MQTPLFARTVCIAGLALSCARPALADAEKVDRQGPDEVLGGGGTGRGGIGLRGALGGLKGNLIDVEEKAEPKRVLVFNVQSVDFPPARLQALANALTAELASYPRFVVISTAEIARLMALEENRQLAGCFDDSCIGEISGALGADLTLFTQVSKIDNVIVADISLIEDIQAKVQARARMRAKSVDGLAERARPAVARLVDAYLLHVIDDKGGASSLSAAAEFEKRRCLSDGFTIVRGKYAKPWDWPSFYREAGRADLAASFEKAQQMQKYASYATVGLVGVGAVGGVATGIFWASDTFKHPSSGSDFAGGMALTGSFGLLGALVGMVVGLPGFLLVEKLYPAHTIPPDERRALVDSYNTGLQHRLGLDEE